MTNMRFLNFVFVFFVIFSTIHAISCPDGYTAIQNITLGNIATYSETTVPVIKLVINTSNSTLWNTTTCSNVRFVNSSSSNLNYELDDSNFCGNTTVNSTFWVGVPYAANYTVIYACLGNTAATNGQNANSLWRAAGYYSVYHASDAGNSILVDSAGYNNLTQSGSGCTKTATSDGVSIGNHLDLGGSCQYLNSSAVYVPQGANTSTETAFVVANSDATCWGMPYMIGQNNAERLVYMDGKGGVANKEGYITYTSDTPNTAASYGVWQRITTKYSGSVKSFYKNGSVYTASTSVATTGTNIALGVGVEGSTWCLKGSIDEVRLSNYSRSDAWIANEYNQTVNVSSTLNALSSVNVVSPNNKSNFTSSSITLTWNASAFSSNPTCNVTRNGTMIYTGVCTVGSSCSTTNNTADGLNYIWNVSCSDGSNTASTSNYSFSVDSTPPSIIVYYPVNYTVYHVNNITVNYSVSDATSGIDTCKGQIDGGSIITLPGCMLPNTGVLADGAHNGTLYVNDTFGNNATTTSYFTTYTGIPVITINAPLNGTINNQYTIINISFTVLSGANISACYYSFDNLSYVNLPGCANFSINLTNFGRRYINIFSNDTYGSIGANMVYADVIRYNSTPLIVLTTPTYGANISNVSTQLAYYFTSEYEATGLCSLYADGFMKKMINLSNYTLDTYNFTSVMNGTHTWSVKCQVSDGIGGFSIAEASSSFNTIYPRTTNDNIFTSIIQDFYEAWKRPILAIFVFGIAWITGRTWGGISLASSIGMFALFIIIGGNIFIFAALALFIVGMLLRYVNM